MEQSEFKNIRWKQRFQNYKKAYLQLSEAVKREQDLSDLEKEGLIQRFEYTFELGWKTLKDFLENKGIEAKFPRDVIKESFRNELIENGESWLSMLDKRNIMAHAYDKEVFESVVEDIVNEYFGQLTFVYDLLKRQK